MEVAIITVYNSLNFGSYWQARALYEKLRSLGYSPIMVNSKARSTIKGIILPHILAIGKSMLCLRLKKAEFFVKELNSYMTNYANINIINQSNVDEAAVCIFGSDEIWNVTRNEMNSHRVLWGEGFEKNRKLSYAPSVNNSSAASLMEFGADRYLGQFSAISVRDEWSKKQLEECISAKIEKVLDPTLLFDSDYYGSPKKGLEAGYIALYYFGCTDYEKDKYITVSRLLKKRIVSLGQWLDWCDHCETDLNPFTYYKDADYVITNTFHGTVFAINYHKNFVVCVNGKRKIEELLNEFGLCDRICDNLAENEIIALFSKDINWDAVDKILLRRRQESERFLINVLNND